MKRAREEQCNICGHYHDYEGGEPCSICGHVLAAPMTYQHAHAMPAEIVPNFLYLGDYNLASRLALLNAMGISHIVCVAPNCAELFRQNLQYWTSPTSPADFEDCFRNIDVCKEKQKRVMVHCMTGASRSPAVVIAYLMRSGMQFDEAKSFVESRWRTCNLSPGDLHRLQELQDRLK